MSTNKPLISFGTGFTPAAEGRHPAVLAEVAFDLIGKKGEEELKMIWCFELGGENDADKEGNPLIVDLKLFCSVSSGNAVGKYWKSWSASKDPLENDQLNAWSHAFMDSLLLTNEAGELILDGKGLVQMRDFASADELIEFTKSDKFKPSMIGATCIVNIKHNESGNRTYANIDGIFINAVPDALGAPTFKDGEPVRAFELTVSDGYKGWHERQAEIADRVAAKNNKNKGNSGSSQQAQAAQAPKSRPRF